MKVFPVIASILSSKELGDFVNKKYALSENFSCELFRTGMNHTYFLSNSSEKYVIRVYSHNWRSKTEILEEIGLLQMLKENNLSVSYPIKDISGNLIQEVNAPEGIRYIVLFSFAKGDKIRFMDQETCFHIGSLMAKIHKISLNKTIKRVDYNTNSLLELPYNHLNKFFSETLPEMKFIKNISQDIIKSFQNTNSDMIRKGIVHMDIWYDNMSVFNKNDITVFDFDFCGNGWQILDIGYFCKQLFHIETDKETYEQKLHRFLDGYKSVLALSDEELQLIPNTGLSVFIFYLGVQAQRFDWSNIFLTKNYLKMYVGKLQSWIDYTSSLKK